MKQIFILLIATASATMLSCHSDYYPDGHRKGSWEAYKDHDGPARWYIYMFWLETTTKERALVDSLENGGIKPAEDGFLDPSSALEFERKWLKMDEDSLKVYEKYKFDWD